MGKVFHKNLQRERHNRNTYDLKTTWEAYKSLIAAINIRVALLSAIAGILRVQIVPNNLSSIYGMDAFVKHEKG